MSDAILRPYIVQNPAIWQEQVQLQNGGSQSPLDVPKKHPNVAVYLRCSTDDQDTESQKTMLHSFLMMHGFELTECELYIDEGVSAKKHPSFTDRPEGSRLMQDIADGKIDHLFGFKIDRFFRRMEQGSAWMNLMARKHPKVKVVTTDCNAPLNTSTGRKWWHFSLLLAEDENEARAERTTGGMQHKQESLQKTSHGVFGWEEYDSGERNITQGRDVGALIKMRPCWHEQAVIEWVKERAEAGDSYSGLMRKLNGWGIPTTTGRKWTSTTVSRLVNKPSKLQDQLHQFDRPARMISAPFRTFKPAHRFF